MGVIGTYPCEAISVLTRFHTDWPLVCIVLGMEPKKKIERFEDLIVWQGNIVPGALFLVPGKTLGY